MSWLFVPGDRPDRFDKAAASGADVVVLDLEDAVAADAKPSARESVRAWLSAAGRGCVRVNAAGTEWFGDDVAALSGLGGLRAVMVPKAEDPEVFTALARALGAEVSLVALVETAVGVHRAHELASCESVARLAFGSVDFALDIGAAEEPSSLLLARSSLVLASRAAGIPSPVDGVTTRLRDTATTRRDAEHAAALGFGSKLCIHPDQVATVNACFRPSGEQLAWARTVLEHAADTGASQLHGQMVDAPVVARARQLLERAEQVEPQDRGPQEVT